MKYVKKLFSMLFEDFHWKLLALFAAGVIWFIGMNISDPYQNYTVSQRLLLENIEIMAREDIIVLNDDALRDTNVSILVRGLRSDIEKLRAVMADPALLAAYVESSVDFRAIDSEAVFAASGVSTQELRISVNLRSGYEHLSINPSHVEVLLDTALQQIYPVDIIQSGSVPPGFELQHINLSNSRVTIRGSRTDLRMVSRVFAEVDITGVHEDAELPVQLRVFDINGEEMTERVQLNVAETTASIRVWQVRQAEIRLRGVGSPANGYASAGISGEISSIEIVGPEELLDGIEYIPAEIDLSGAYSNITQTINISELLPQGINLRKDEQTEFTATARIEPIEERTFSIPTGNIRSLGVVGRYQLVDENAQIRVTVSGPRSTITTLTANEIILEFDLRTLPIGTHTVPLRVELPPGITLVGQPPTLVFQILEPAALTDDNGNEIPEPSPSPDPAEIPVEDDDTNPEDNELYQ